MRKVLLFLLFHYVWDCNGQKIYFPQSKLADSSTLVTALPLVAKQAIALYKNENKVNLSNLYRLQIIARDYTAALHIIDSLKNINYTDTARGKGFAFHFRVFCEAMKEMNPDAGKNFDDVYEDKFTSLYSALPAKAISFADVYFSAINTAELTAELKSAFYRTLEKHKNSGNDSIDLSDAVLLCRSYCHWIMYDKTLPLAKNGISAFEKERFIIEDRVLVTTSDAASVSLTITRRKDITAPQPAVMVYTIYAGNDRALAKETALRGYVGIVANTRGKRLSANETEPFEHDAKDAYNIINWISKQPWCNGEIGMYGGSYLGFSQWSALKYPHPALKTIIPQVSVGVGKVFPCFNNVFMIFMLRWIHLVTNNKLVDAIEFSDENKWNSLYNKWYKSGSSFRSLDTLEGRPNFIFQRWLDHPSYDSYWQSMIPQEKEYAKINIPILTITGYYDDDQLGALYYYEQHHLWNKKAEHYLLIGPYDHYGAQGSPPSEIYGYKIDPVANISIDDVVFQWLDYILKDSSKPAILKDKVNYEVMGTNEWKHASSLSGMNSDTITFYLSNIQSGNYFKLSGSKPLTNEYIRQEINFMDRTDTIKPNSKFKIIEDSIETQERLTFISDPLQTPIIINGSFKASVNLAINKKDVDLVVDLYELMPNGQFFLLGGDYRGVVLRASYAKDNTKRKLLHPGKQETIPINRTYFTSKKMGIGSRIVVSVGVNKRPDWQINYGSGKDVSDETISDGKEPLQIRWYNSSFIRLPVQK